METLYDVLKVKEDAPPEVIRAAYQTLSSMFHPDKNPGNEAAAERMKKINAAYRILRNSETRARYDDLLRRSMAREKESQEEKSQKQDRPQESSSVNSDSSEKPQKANKSSRWHNVVALVASVVLARLIGILGALIVFLVFYWIKPKRGTGQAVAVSVVAGVVVAAIFSTALQATWRDWTKPAAQAQATSQTFSQDSQPTPYQQQAPQVNWSDYTPVEKPAPVATPQQQLQPSLSAQEIHMQQIYAAHADADTIFTSADFQDWLMRTPQFKNTPSVGSTQEVIDMFSAYKRLYEPDWENGVITPPASK
jgi:curved DNA-binding protein CbpA